MISIRSYSIGSCYVIRVIRHPLHYMVVGDFEAVHFAAVSRISGPMQVSTTQNCHRWRRESCSPGLVFCTGPNSSICIYPLQEVTSFADLMVIHESFHFFGKIWVERSDGKGWIEEFHRVSKPALASFRKSTFSKAAKQQARNLVFCCWLWLACS